MNSFKKSLDFFAKNFLLIVPLYVAIAIPLLIMGNMAARLLSRLPAMMQAVTSGGMEDPMELFQGIMRQTASMMGSSSLASGLGFILSVLATPITYGLIRRALKNEPVGLQFSLDALKETFVSYILYLIGVIVLAIVVGIAITIVTVILGLIFMNLGILGTIILVVYGLGVLVAFIYFGIRAGTFWFPAMLMDNKGIMDGLKQGFAATKGSFWPLLGISLLIAIAIGIASGILSFITGVPVIGPLISGAVSAIGSFVLMIFYLMFYIEKTQGAAEAPPQDA